MADTTPAETPCPHCAGEQSRIYRPGAPEDWPEITSPEAAANTLLPLMSGLDREHCITLNLDTRHRLLATTTVSIGSVDHTFMSPREVFRDALLRGASAIVIAHNHPSGDPEPSLDDQRVTRRLADAVKQSPYPPRQPGPTGVTDADPGAHAEALTDSGQHAEFLTAAQLAERWQVPVRTVYGWARRNAVPHYRAGRLLRFDPKAVEEHFRCHGFAEELVADPERPGESAFSLLSA